MPRSSLVRVLNEIHGRPWAITAEELENIAAIVDRAVNREQELESVAAKLGRPLENSGNGSEVRNGVAILGIDGPIYRYANLFTFISGATSVETLALDFQRALENSAVDQVLFVVNSPGGQVDGIQEFADMIRMGSRIKPVTAYVDGLAASAAYWLAAAAQTIATAETGMLGSVGVVASILDNRGQQERQGVRRHEIVSSNAPNKRPDPATDAGRAQIQELVDSLEAVMIQRIAAFRGTTPEAVARDFGRGKTLIASQAIAAGMADEITTYEPLVARLAAGYTPRALFSISSKESTMEDPKPTPPAAPAPAAPAAPAPAPAATTATTATAAITASTFGAERQRISAILSLPEAKGRDSLARTLALDTDASVEVARNILSAAPGGATDAPPPKENPLAAAMSQLPNPKVGTGNPAEDDSPEAEARRVLAFVPKDRKLAG